MKDSRKTKIIRNAAKCTECKDVIESTYRHDFVGCSCGAIFVDGGHAYLRRVGDPKKMIEMSVTEFEDGTQDQFECHPNTGGCGRI